MESLFKCKVEYDKMFENGLVKPASELYLVEAVSFPDAETRIIEELRPYVNGDIMVVDISRFIVNSAILNDTGDYYYRAKADMIVLDERQGKEKKLPIIFLINADDLDEAKDRLNEELRKSLGDYSVAKIEETKIIDFFKI